MRRSILRGAGDLCRDGQREDRRRRDRINLLVDLVKLKCVPKNVENWLDPTDGEQPQMRSEFLRRARNVSQVLAAQKTCAEAQNLQKVARRAFQKAQICRGACRRALWLKYVPKSEIECRVSHLPPQILKNVPRFSTFGDIFQVYW